jgi:hypothetical protein
MINEHDIADMMDQAYDAIPEETKKVSLVPEGEDLVLDFKPFLMSYTKAVYDLTMTTWGIKSKSEWFQEGYEAGVHDSGGKG